jgi:hypothetical protein
MGSVPPKLDDRSPWVPSDDLLSEIENLARRDEATERLLVELWKDAAAAARHYEVMRSTSSQIFLGFCVASAALLLGQGNLVLAGITGALLSFAGVVMTAYFHEAHVYQWYLANFWQSVISQGTVVKTEISRPDIIQIIRKDWWNSYKSRSSWIALRDLEWKFAPEFIFTAIHIVNCAIFSGLLVIAVFFSVVGP